jgi:putative hydrolase of the HAD superfamily
MIKAVLFDLDDTLYPERAYRQSGLRHLSHVLGRPEYILDLLEEFDRRGAEPVAQVVKMLLAEYRAHDPTIAPYPEVPAVLTQLAGQYPLGLVTDDPTGAQQRKIDALGIAGHFRHVTIARPPHVKPTRRPYLDTLEALHVEPHDAVFVGDDRDTDILGANRVGMRAIQIIRDGQMKTDQIGPAGSEPAAVIHSLAELPQAIEELSHAPAR